MRSTQQLREVWGPACKKTGRGIGEAYGALDMILERWDYTPRKGVTGAYNCRQITGGTRYSLHAYGPESTFTFYSGVTVAMAIAVDINWDRNPYGPRLVTDMPRGMVDEICALRTGDNLPVWRWGGYYAGNKDAMHFEIVASPSELARGIRIITKPPAAPAKPTPEPQAEPEEDDVKTFLVGVTEQPHVFYVVGMERMHVFNPDDHKTFEAAGVPRLKTDFTLAQIKRFRLVGEESPPLP